MYKKVMLVLVLLCLILLSMIAWKVGVFAGIANLFDPMVIDKIGDWFARASSYANFCTLFLFLLFVIGKIWISLIVKVVVSKKIYFLFFQVIRYCSVPDVSINKLSSFIGNHVRHRIRPDYHHFE